MFQRLLAAKSSKKYLSIFFKKYFSTNDPLVTIFQDCYYCDHLEVIAISGEGLLYMPSKKNLNNVFNQED